MSLKGQADLWRAFAKVNLELRVLGRRPDGYHEVRTILQVIDLADEILVSESDAFRFTSSSEPAGPSNLVVRAVRAFEAETGIDVRLHMHLTKHIPSGAGLGGGSADAAVTLAGLARRFQTRIPGERLWAILEDLGSDVPFFSVGGRALCVGRGERVFPLEDQVDYWLVLALPRIRVSTREAYSWLTEVDESNTIQGFCAAFEPGLGAAGPAPDAQLNDFEAPLFRRFPELAEIKRKLSASGARFAALTGSGAALYGQFLAEDDAKRAARSLGSGVQVRLVRPLGRERYCSRMFDG